MSTNIIANIIAGLRARFSGVETIEGLGSYRAALDATLQKSLAAADGLISKTITLHKAKIDAAQDAANKALDEVQTRAAQKAAAADAEFAAGRAIIRAAVDGEINAIEQTVRAAIRRAETLQTSGVAERGAQAETVAALRSALATLEAI